MIAASGLVIGCSGVAPARHIPQHHAPHIVEDIARPRALPIKPQPTPPPMDGVFVLVTPATDGSKRLPRGTTDQLTSLVKQMAARHGVSTSWPDGFPTAAALAARRCRGFTIATRVHQLAITTIAHEAQIRCNVKLHIAPWHGSDGGERWEAHLTATGSGSALATARNEPEHVERGIRDCLEGAVEAAATREVLPFLKRVTPAITRGDRYQP